MNRKDLVAKTDPVQVMRQVDATKLPEGLEEKLVSENQEHTETVRKTRKRKRRPNGTLAPKDLVKEVPEVVDERAEMISLIAKSTPEVRYREAGIYSDDEIKIIAAALVSRMPLYKVAATLKCSLHRVLNAVEVTPSLKQIAEDQKITEKMMAQEAVDDCIKARVPAVVMWHAQHVLPEKYGDQVNIDNEDDTRIVIGGLDEGLVAEAEEEVAAAANSTPDGGGVALLDAMEQERGAENAAAGGDVSMDPLAETPPAPSLNPPAGDERFGGYVPASELRRTGVEMPASDDDGGGDAWDDGMMDNNGIF